MLLKPMFFLVGRKNTLKEEMKSKTSLNKFLNQKVSLKFMTKIVQLVLKLNSPNCHAIIYRIKDSTLSLSKLSLLISKNEKIS